MAKKEHKKRIDAQWQALQPGWAPKEHGGERKMLYNALEDGENIERLLAGGWKVLWGRNAMEDHGGGIVVATDRQVLFLNKGRFSKNVSQILYWDILSVNKPRKAGPGTCRISSLDYNYEMRLPAAEADPFVNFVRSRLLTEDAQAEELFSSFLESGESVEYWTRCFAGEEMVYKTAGSDGRDGREEYWLSDYETDTTVIVMATDRRVLLVAGDYIYLDVPNGNFLTVKHLDKRLMFAVLGSAQVYLIRPTRESEVQKLADIIQDRLTPSGRLEQKQARVSAEWQIQQPIWSERKKHNRERKKLPEIMEDGERLEGLLSGEYRPSESGLSHTGVIAATDRRLVFVSESIASGKNVGHIPYEGIVDVTYEKGRVHEEIWIYSIPKYPDYRISSINGERPRSTQQSGYGEEFAVLVRGFLAQLTAPTSPSLEAAKAKMARINARWQRTPDWKMSTRKDEREKLYEVIHDDETIERLLEGDYKADVKGAKKHNVVIAATDRRLLFVNNQSYGEHLNELSYSDIDAIEFQEGTGFLSMPRITITGRAGANNYILEGVWLGTIGTRFIKCVRGHLAGSQAGALPSASSTTVPAVPASPSVASAPKRTRIDAQWQDRSPSWKLSTRKNEREKLYEVLYDDEDIGRLIEGRYKAGLKSAGEHDVVVAATDRRLIFVHNGHLLPKHLNQMLYSDIARIEVNDEKLLSLTYPRIAITGLGNAPSYVLEVDDGKSYSYRDEMDLFVDYVQGQLPESESSDEYLPDGMESNLGYVELTNLPEPAVPTEQEFNWKKRS